ncbi:hypothetical protein BDV28DRAFT_69842 [Aspergillus coremiiformis]|uniref:Ubiquitin interaction motif protein n=1 Tax=Aspergillus coremiiformis TaxID=138285 RepID=A0A5N6ZAY3_9EURO|nr:hypothetical protein BDV28DRAFT_69842 [Aspergillus coremiiformis]
MTSSIMASEPTEEAIANFVSFTSTSREQAISFLKANDLNSNKAINAYFEDPSGSQIQTANYLNDPNIPSFHIEHSDPVPSSIPPSRPPTTLSEKVQAPEYQQASHPPSQNATDSNKGLSLAEQEERELQQAVAMSLSQNLGQQETGVTTSKQSNFGKATRDFYDEGAWAMTLFNSSAREIIISPDPGDRKKVEGEPAFLRPSEDGPYLSGLLTILHSIPLAREALLQRNMILSNYGHDPQWWNGQPINLPKIVTIQDAHDGDMDWDDIIYETQRLVAFLDNTERSFGSVDALVSLKSMATYDTEGSISRFLETWQEAAVRADPGNQLATALSSKACKRPLTVYNTPIHKDFFILESFVDPEHGQTLYDVLDRAIWADRPGEELDDVWLEHAGEIFIIKLESTDSAKPVDVKIPAVFYPDRYLADSRDFSREFRAQRLLDYDGIFKLENLINRFSVSKSAVHKGMTFKETLEKTAAAVSLTLPKSLANGANGMSLSPEAVNEEARHLADELREVSRKIEEKLTELVQRRETAIETLRSYTKILTEPSHISGKTPHHKYTLRGVCTKPHVTYVLRPQPRQNEMADTMSTAVNEWQWWRISFSTDDAKARPAESQQGDTSSSKNADVIGYTARKVREVEVLKAAREESKSALLVYANDNAMNFQEEPVPFPLQEFVNADNIAFDAEFGEQGHRGNSSEKQNEDANSAVRFTECADMNEFSQDGEGQTASTIPNVNVFDYQVSDFDEADEPGQEMQEKGGRALLGQSSTAGPVQYSPSTNPAWDQ